MEKARQLALVSILAIRPLADVFKLVTRICHFHCHILSWIVLLVLLVGIELVSSSTRVTSVKSAKRLGVRDNRPHRYFPFILSRMYRAALSQIYVDQNELKQRACIALNGRLF